MDQDSMEALPNESTLEINTNLRGDMVDLNSLNDTSSNHTKHNNQNPNTSAIIISTFTIVVFIAGLYYITTKSIP